MGLGSPCSEKIKRTRGKPSKYLKSFQVEEIASLEVCVCLSSRG